MVVWVPPLVGPLAGAAVDSGTLIATIVPDGAELHARLFVPTRAIGRVHPGQAVAIRYEAFSYQKYGTFKGRIADVSNSVLLPQEVEKISPGFKVRSVERILRGLCADCDAGAQPARREGKH